VEDHYLLSQSHLGTGF